MYGSRRRTGFRSIRGRRRFRPTAYRAKRVSYWRGRRQRWVRKNGNFINRTSQLAKLKYAYGYDLDASGTVFADQVFNMNSLYDPQYALGGGQPSGLPELVPLWQRYKVSACKVTARWVNTGTQPVRVGFYACDDSYVTPNTSKLLASRLLEMSAVTKVILPSNFGDTNTATMSRFYRMKSIMGSFRMSDDNVSAALAANPQHLAHVHCVVLNDIPSDLAPNTSSARLYITLKFYAKFSVNKIAPTN